MRHVVCTALIAALGIGLCGLGLGGCEKKAEPKSADKTADKSADKTAAPGNAPAAPAKPGEPPKPDPAKTAADAVGKVAGIDDYGKNLAALKTTATELKGVVTTAKAAADALAKLPGVPAPVTELNGGVGKALDALNAELDSAGASAESVSKHLDQFRKDPSAKTQENLQNELKTFQSHFGPVKDGLAKLDEIQAKIATMTGDAGIVAKPALEALSKALAPVTAKVKLAKDLDAATGPLAQAVGAK